MRCTDPRPPFAGLHGKELDALLFQHINIEFKHRKHLFL